MSAIVFMDTETLGLSIASPIWEFAAVRREESGVESGLHLFIHHDIHPWLDVLPEQFREDYKARWDDLAAVEQDDAAEQICRFINGAHVVGAVPDFDTTRIRHQLLAPTGLEDPWHYHLIDVENLVVGYLAGRPAVYSCPCGGCHVCADHKAKALAPPWKSDHLSLLIGVDPSQFDRHTAMGDVRWVMAQYDAVMGGAA